jgi:hypothetical protein
MCVGRETFICCTVANAFIITYHVNEANLFYILDVNDHWYESNVNGNEK